MRSGRLLTALAAALVLLGGVAAIVAYTRGPPAVRLAIATCALALSLAALSARLAMKYREARRRLESALLFQRQLIEQIPIPVFYKDQARVYLGCNRSYERFMGRDRSQIIGKTVFDIAPRELAEIYEQQDLQLLERGGEQVYEYVVRSEAPRAERHVVFHKALFQRPGGRLGGIIGAITDVTDRWEAEQQKERVIAELRQALDRVKRLTGLLPICMHCHKIRDDRGYWSRIETYIREHSDAEFSHGLCPDCLRLHYPGSGEGPDDGEDPSSER